MNITLFLTTSEVLELHNTLIQRFGGKIGVRDMGLLESALMRPQTGYYNSLSLEAAALFQSLSLNHCFIDGNKRVAFAATAIFLRMNGYKLKVSADDGESFLIGQIIENKISIDNIADWIERHIQHIKQPSE